MKLKLNGNPRTSKMTLFACFATDSDEAPRPLKVLSLFAGIGGLDLAFVSEDLRSKSIFFHLL